MKQKYFILIFLITSGGFAQTIDIPDPNFKAALLHYGTIAINTDGDNYVADADTNNDGEIQVSEALLVTGLNLYSNPYEETNNIISMEGIQYFTNLKSLKCPGNAIGSLDVSMLPSLEFLNCAYNQISSLNINELSQLKEVQCQGNNLSSLDLTGVSNLEVLYAQENHLSTLSFASIPSVRELWLAHNEFTMIDATMLPALESLACNNNQLSQLNVAGLGNLKAIEASYNSIASLDLSGINQLNQLFVSNNIIPSIDLSTVTVLNYLDLADNPLTAIDLSGLSNLEYLRISNTLVSSIDCSQTAVMQLSCKDNPNLTSVNIRNNVFSYNDENMLWYTLFFGNLPSLQSVCVDDGEQDSIIPGNFYNVFGNVAVHTGSNCDIEIQMGIAENNSEKFMIYPNPAANTVQIQNNNSLEEFSLTIVSVTGIMVKKSDNVKPGTPIDISGLASGTYFLKIENGIQSDVQKLIKL